MTAEVLAHSINRGDRKSRSPSVGAIGISGRTNRKITVIDGNFLREDSSSSPVVPKASISPPSSVSSPPPPVSPSLSSSGSYYPVSIGEHPQPMSVETPVSRLRSMTSPPEMPSLHSRGHSRDSSDISLTSVSDEPTSLSHSFLDKIGNRSKSPSAMSWRSSTSSLADTSLYSLVQQPSSEVSILHGIKKQMLHTIQRTKELQQETIQIPKLRKDVTELTQERQKLLNELLEQNAVVLQLKQRVSLLHEQNQELAKLARTDIKGGVGGPVLAIRNTLITTLAQLKQMEDQVQSIPTLRNQIRELTDENARLKEKDQQLALPSADPPEGVSGSQYQALLNENETLRESNEQLITEVSAINKQLRAISDNCEGLHKRVGLFQSSRSTNYPLQERIKQLEVEKDALYQQMVDSKFHGQPTVDLDKMHLKKKVTSLKKMNSKLRAKIEELRLNTKREKEHLVLKLFEIELLNTKTSTFEVEKKVVNLERLHIDQTRSLSVSSSISPSPQPSNGTYNSEEDQEPRSLSPDSQLQLLKFKQLEIHSHESRNVLQALMSERQEMESRIYELQNQLEEIKQSNSQQKLEETESKLSLAQDRIQSLERGLKEMTPDGTDGSDESLPGKFGAMQEELKRLSKVERNAVGIEGKLRDLEQTKYTNEKLRHDKHKLEKKSREGRHHLKTLVLELAQSAELVKSYQKQCLDMESQLEKSTEDSQKLKEDNASLRAELQVKDLEVQSHVKTGANGAAAAATVEASVVSELQDKYSQLLTELSSLTDKHKRVTKKLVERESEVENLKSEVDELAASDKKLEDCNGQLSEKVKALEGDLEMARKDKQRVEELSSLLSEKTKMSNEFEIQLKELKESHQSLQAEAKTDRDRVESLTAELRKTGLEKDSLQQKVDILSDETPTLVKQSTELKVAKDEAERRVEVALKEQEETSAKVVDLEERLQKSEKMGKEYRSKLRLLQADLDEAESKLDRIMSSNEELKNEISKMKEDSTGLANKLKAKEQDVFDVRQQLEREKSRLVSIEKQLHEAEGCADAEKARSKELQKELNHVRDVEVKKLHSELSKTVTEMGQLTTDYSTRVARIRELESSYQQAEAEKDSLSRRLNAAEKDLEKAKKEAMKKEEELKESKVSQSTLAAAQSRSHSEEVRKLKDEVAQYQLQKKKSDKELKSLKDESSLLKEQSKINHNRLTDIQKILQRRDDDVRKAYDNIAVQNKEFESCKKKLSELEAQCEMLTATKDNLLRRLDRMEKLEMEHELLKHKVQEALGQSSQLRNDNKALLQLLEGVETERPTFEKEATRNLQEENIELHQQVSLLSQWNDKHQRTITTLEQQVDNMEDEKRQILVELMQMQSHEQENKQLKKELGEVEMEVNRLRRQAHTELLQEEMKVKMETQGQLLSVFNEHNKALQSQVTELHARIKELGGQLARDKPVSPPPMPAPSDDLQLGGLESVRRCSELEVINTNLQQKIAYLEAELLSAQEISPKIRRRSSAFLATSSIPSVPDNEDAFISVPEEMLLPCSVLADAFINKISLPESMTENYLRTIGEGWFGAVAQKSVTAQCILSYTTTFDHLSERLLRLIVNMKDMRGNTALHHTLANGNFPAVSVLLNLKCCNTNSTNKAGHTPIMLAAAHNVHFSEHKPVMQKLLNKTDLNIKSKVELQTALMLAVSSGSLELVSLFLDAGANVNAQDKDGSTALMFACEKGYEEIVKKLLSTPTCDISLKDNDSQTAFDISSSYSHGEICSLLRKHKKTKKR